MNSGQQLRNWLQLHRRWVLVALLYVIAALNNLDRQVLSVLAPLLRSQLRFGFVEYSNVVAGFLSAYTLGYAFSGPILDRWGARFGLTFGLVLWSLAGLAHSFATGWITLLVCRFLLGLGESFNSPGGLKAIAEWVPRKERALASAIFSNGNVMGPMLAPPLVSVLTICFGWRSAFVVTGLAGFALASVWGRFYRRSKPPIEESAASFSRAEVRASRTGYAQLLRNPPCLALCFARFLTDATNYFFAFWLPDYFQHGRGFSLALIGSVGWLPFLAADLGGPGGGFLSDRLVRQGYSSVRARLGLMGGAALVMPLAMAVVRVDATWLALALMAAVLAAQSCWMANQLALVTESAPRNAVATLVSVSAMAGGLGGIVANLIAGRVIATHGYFPVFSVVGWAHLLAWLALAAAFRGRCSPRWNPAETSPPEL